MDYRFDDDVQKLRVAIREAAVREIAAFSKATGVTPAGVVVEMIETTIVRDGVRQYAVANVRVRFEF